MSSKVSDTRDCAGWENLQLLLNAMQEMARVNYCIWTPSPHSTDATNWRNSLSEPQNESSSPSLSEAESVALQMFNACLTPEQTRLLSILLRYGDLILSMKSQDATATNVSLSLSRRSAPPTDGKPTRTVAGNVADLTQFVGQRSVSKEAWERYLSHQSTKTEP